MFSPQNILAVIALVFAIAAPVSADEYEGSARFSIEDLQIVEANGFDYVRLKDGVPQAPAGSPALPAVQLDVAIPADAEMLGVAVTYADAIELEGVFDVVPMTQPSQISGRDRISGQEVDGSPFEKDPAVYGRNLQFPGYQVEYLATWNLVGQRFAKLAFHPIQYNPASGKLTFATEIRFRLTWSKAAAPVAEPTFNLTRQGKAHYEKTLLQNTLNPDDVIIPEFTGAGSAILPPGQFEHVILTPQAFETNWDRLVEWHIRKGLPGIVVSKEFVLGSYEGQDAQEKIRRFIEDAHTAWGARYFLIGADGGSGDEQVPYHERYLLGEYVPNDTFYADYDNDWVVDVNVGRASVTSPDEIANFIDKVLTYEKTPPLNDYGKNVLGVDIMNSGAPAAWPGAMHDLHVWVNDGLFLAGELLSAHKNGSFPVDEHHRRLFTERNLSGDPAMPIWRDEPTALTVAYESPVITGTQDYEVSVADGEAVLANALVCLWKDGEVYSFGKTDGLGKKSFTIDPATAGTLFVTATAQDRIPHEGEVAVHENVPPVVFSVDPAKGPDTGSSPVIIHGSGFLAELPMTITFGDGAATDVRVIDESSLTCLTPAHDAGAVDVDVSNELGRGTLPAGYTFTALPQVNSVSPTEGPTAGGTAITIDGDNFMIGGLLRVRFGGVSAKDVVVVDNVTITCTTPAHAAGTVDVTVTNDDGTGNLSDGFTYYDPPDLISVSPEDGASTGGTSVTLSGTEFHDLGTTTVTFGGSSATDVTVVSTTTITCTTPAHAAGAVDVVVANDFGADTLANGFTYHNPPAVSSVSPEDGPITGGTAVTLTGSDFTTTPDTAVTFGGTAAANIVVVNATTITCDTPAHAGGGVDVVVTTSYGSGTLPGGFVYHDPPDLVSINPESGSHQGGTPVILTGTGFTTTGATTVTFEGYSALNIVVVDATTITCETPTHPVGPVDVTVTNEYGSDTLYGGYTYDNSSVITAVDPSEGPSSGGTGIWISGSGFTSAADTTVTFGGELATNVAVLFGLYVTCDTPPHNPGLVDVVVTNSNGAGTLVNGFTYLESTVEVTGVDPANGAIFGNLEVTITGAGFTTTPDTTITFDGLPATEVNVVNPATITCKTPAHSPAIVDLVVTNSTGFDTLAGGFTYHPVPTITKVKPAFGNINGGATATITGTDFSELSNPKTLFGGVEGSDVVVVSATEITCITPAFPIPGPVKVEVRTDFGWAAKNNAFTYLVPAGQPPKNLTDVDTLNLNPGNVVKHAVTGDAGAMYILFLSLGPGPLNTMWGTAGLEIPIYPIYTGFVNGLNYDVLPLVMPNTGLGFINFYTHTLVDGAPSPLWAEDGNNPNGTGGIMWGLN